MTCDEEITKNSCPCCLGSGSDETRREHPSGTYFISVKDCWFCEGARVVGPEKFAEWAKIRDVHYKAI